MRVTIEDIARNCGFSIALVSRVLNNDPTLKIPDATRDRILNEVESLGYVADSSARRLALKRGANADEKRVRIGCIVISSYNKLGHPYFTRILRGALDAVEQNDCELSYCLSVADLLQLFSEGRQEEIPQTEGMLLFADIPDKDMRKFIEKRTRYIVCLNEIINPHADFVGTEVQNNLLMALEYIVNKGYRDIGMLIAHNNEYLAACSKFAESRGIQLNSNWIVYGDYRSEITQEQVAKLLKTRKPPQALLAWNDEMALGGMTALLDAHYRIPQDVAIVGHDDISMSSYAPVPLTTVKIYKNDIGRLAVKILLERIESRRSVPIRVVVPGKLIVRASC